MMSCQMCSRQSSLIYFFFFNDTATTEIYTLSLHDALPISGGPKSRGQPRRRRPGKDPRRARARANHAAYFTDRKSTRLNSSHSQISYAVFCLKKKKHNNITLRFGTYTDVSSGYTLTVRAFA